MLEGLRILLVEDDDVDRMRVHRAVRKAGAPFELCDAEDVASAQAALDGEDFDCAVIDYNLPDGTALDLLAYNATRRRGRVPMVVLTGNDDDERAIEALHEGAEDYLVKATFEVESFFRSIRYAMERASMRRDLQVTNDRLARELAIGGSIQTSILPRNVAVAGLEIVARMAPATEVGGDYYDVLPTSDGCWIGIGDVAGHGMGAAIVALMTQSVVASLTRFRPEANPGDVVCLLNDVLYDNIRLRLEQDEHMTLTLFRYHHDGRVVFAGAHEEVLVHRADSGAVETVPTPGTWLGARRSIEDVTVEGELYLGVGDTMLLYTDGVTEARNAEREQYALDRPIRILSEHAAESVAELHRRIWDDVVAFSVKQEDDLTLLALRRTG